MDNAPSKKMLYLGIAAAILLISGGLIWYWRKQKITEAPVVPETPAVEETTKQLKELEEQIGATKGELEKIEHLSPEEQRQREEQRQILSAQEVTADVSIEGVEISLVGDRKEITNRKEGYRITVPVNLVIARSIVANWLELHDPQTMCEDPSCDPIILISVAESNPKELPMREWLAAEEKNAGGAIYSPREELPIGGAQTFRVTESVPPIFEGFSYYLSKGKKIYSLRISGTNEPKYREFIETFSFL